MVRFAPNRPRWGHMAFDMEFSEMEVVLELIKDRVANLEFREIPVPNDDKFLVRKVSEATLRHHSYTHKAEMKIWEERIKPIFESAKRGGNGVLHIKDPRLLDAMAVAGRNPSGLTSMISWLNRKGVLFRTGKGSYKLP